jgi:hypothetical protein
MTTSQAKRASFDIIRRQMLRGGFKGSELVGGLIYAPYIPLYTTQTFPTTAEVTDYAEKLRRRLQEKAHEVYEFGIKSLAAS